MSLRSSGLAAGLLVFGGLVGPVWALAQQDSSATLSGTVVSASTGAPLYGALVVVTGTSIWDFTDDSGHFQLTHIPPGRHVIKVTYHALQTRDFPVDLLKGQLMRASLQLDLRALALDPVLVEAQPFAELFSYGGFLRRQLRGHGRFLMREDFERRKTARLSDILSTAGMTLACRGSVCRPVAYLRGRPCPVSVFVDDRPWTLDVNQIPLERVGAVELYRGPEEIPVEYHLFGQGCAAIVIWLRWSNN